MAGQKLDFSFERDGRSLDVWLRDLVAEDAAARLAAGKALQAMQYGVRSVDSKLSAGDWNSCDVERRGELFTEAVRAAVSGRGFPRREFVRRLIALRLATYDDWIERVKLASRKDERTSAVEDRLVSRVSAAANEAERTEAVRRFMRWLCASISRNCKRTAAIYAGAEAMSAASFMAASVFEAIDSALLVDRNGLDRMLNHKQLYIDAARALARIGPSAVVFAAFFLDQLDAESRQFEFEGARALGSIGRDDPVVIDAILARVRRGSETVRIGAILTLGHAGPPLAGRMAAAIDMLIGATHNPALSVAATWALASVGRDNQQALLRVLEVASPRPSRWRSDELHPEGRWNETMCERGSAISALHHFGRFSAEIVPVLVDAIDSFDEFDPDWDYFGEHARVCRALSAFGAQGAAAVPRLARYLDALSLRPDADRSAPDEVCRLLASWGEAARAALPALESVRKARACSNGATSGSLDPDEPIDRAILAIRGEL